jgi:hypothetical protein
MASDRPPSVHFVPDSPEDVDYRALAETVYTVAAERQAAALKVRDAVLAALDRGDVVGARGLVERWTEEAIEEIAASL